MVYRHPHRPGVLCLGRDVQPLPFHLRRHLGSKYAAANAGLLYTSKGTASLLVPLSSVLAAATGSWHMVFIVASVLNAIAALMAWFVLKMRKAHMAK